MPLDSIFLNKRITYEYKNRKFRRKLKNEKYYSGCMHQKRRKNFDGSRSKKKSI